MVAKLLREWHPGPGVAVEVGAHNGEGWGEVSEREGWKFICLEPHPGCYAKLRLNRLGSLCYNVAASDKTGIKMMLTTREGICSSLEPGVEDVIRDVYHSYHVEGYKEVPCITLDDLFLAHPDIVGGGIDVIIIDTEGHDLSVLKGLNLGVWRPRLVIVEQLPQNQVSGAAKVRAVDELMSRAGYMMAGHESADSFYLRDEVDAKWWRARIGKRWFEV